MVETDRGSGHTAGKRRQRSDLRNPEVRRMVRDGELSISSKFKRVRETRSFNADYSQDALLQELLESWDLHQSFEPAQIPDSLQGQHMLLPCCLRHDQR